MTSVIDALYELKYNPFKYGYHLASFYSELDKLEHNILLSQLVIPLCTHPFYSKKIYNSNIRSSLWSVFNCQENLYDLQERIDEFQTLTEQCINYCLVNDWLNIDIESLSISAGNNTSPDFTNIKVAEKLARLFNGNSAMEIYSFLKVKPR